MKKKLLLSMILSIVCYAIMAQGATNITFDNGGEASLKGWASSACKLAHWLVSVGLLIGIVPATKKWLMGEPNAHKNVINWFVALILGNILIEGLYDLFIVYANNPN